MVEQSLGHAGLPASGSVTTACAAHVCTSAMCRTRSSTVHSGHVETGASGPAFTAAERINEAWVSICATKSTASD